LATFSPFPKIGLPPLYNDVLSRLNLHGIHLNPSSFVSSYENSTIISSYISSFSPVIGSIANILSNSPVNNFAWLYVALSLLSRPYGLNRTGTL
jgi:hypothetical protein